MAEAAKADTFVVFETTEERPGCLEWDLDVAAKTNDYSILRPHLDLTSQEDLNDTIERALEVATGRSDFTGKAEARCGEQFCRRKVGVLMARGAVLVPGHEFNPQS